MTYRIAIGLRFSQHKIVLEEVYRGSLTGSTLILKGPDSRWVRETLERLEQLTGVNPLTGSRWINISQEA